MGLFGSKKKTYVSSSVWNMAGDIQERTDFLETVVVSNVLMDTGSSIGEVIPATYLNGPGMGLRRYASWARGSSNYNNNVGFVGGSVTMGASLDSEALAAQIPHGPNEFVVMGQSDIGLADYTWWAEEYMVNNHQDLLFTNWFSSIADNTNVITITFEDTTTESFIPVDYDPTKRYLYALYQVVSGGVNGPITPGSIIIVVDESGFPPTIGYRLYSDIDTTTPDVLETLTVVDVTYSDATPPEHSESTTTTPVDLLSNEKTYDKFTLIDVYNSTRELYIQTRKDTIVAGTPVTTVVTEDIGGGVIKTTTTTVTAEEVELELSYHIDTQAVVNDSYSDYMYFRYKENTGNAALDAMFAPSSSTTPFLPYIPIRIDNQFIRDTDPDLYVQTKKAYKRAMAGANLDKVVDDIETNEDLEDLDFVYAVYGTSLNSPENTARAYMFAFFDKMLSTNPDSMTLFEEWQANWALADSSMDAYLEWAANRTPTSTEPPPQIIAYPSLPVLNIDIKSTTEWMNFHMNIAFNGAAKSSGIGSLGGHKRGDYWIEVKPTVIYIKKYVKSSSDGTSETATEEVVVEQLTIYHQDLDNHWTAIDVYGLVHTNYVYDNKTVVISGSSAMSDPEESGFIIPLHEETLKEMRLVDSTQMATACCYLVFNCYEVVKQKWYQTGFFKILVVIVSVVVSIVFVPAGMGSAGILGSSFTVGSTLGFSGAAALVAGTIANALAAVIVTKALTAVFGEKWGVLLGGIVTLTLTAMGGITGGGSFDTGSMISELSKADNLIAITDSLVSSVSSYMQGKAQEIMAETQAMLAKYRSEMLEVQKQYEEMFGTGSGSIDPLMFTDSNLATVGEPSSAFIERTLMCGSDVANMTNELITDFSNITLSVELPI